MCELLGMCSSSPAVVGVCLDALASRGTRAGPNHDGWGIAAYHDRGATLVKDPGAAVDSEVVRFIESQEYLSNCLVSHLRHATNGAITYENTQPFQRELGGRAHLFCHNGDVQEGVGELRSRLGRFRPYGETDSELAFCALLARLEPLWLHADGVPSLESRMDVLVEEAAELRSFGPANFLYADGDALFAHSHWRLSGGRGSPPAPGLFLLTEARGCRSTAFSVQPSPHDSLSIVASVPLGADRWTPMEEGELIAVRRGQVLTRSVPDGAHRPPALQT